MAARNEQDTIRSEALANELIEWITEGQTLRAFCREKSVSKSAIYDWLEADEELAGRIALARARGFDEIAAETLDIADDGSRDYTAAKDAEGNEREVVDHDHIQRSKLRVETRLKLLAKWDPKRYGDKQQIEHSGRIDLAGGVREARERVAKLR